MTFLGIFNCRPISAFWTGQGKCLPFKQFAIGYAIVNITTSLTVWLMPIPKLWKLQLPTAQKVALILIFALGLFDCAVSLIRLISSMLVLGNWDVTYDYARGVIWSIVEVSIGIVCSCLPTMRVILASILSEKLARVLRFSGLRSNSDNSRNTRPTESTELREPWTIQDGSGNQHYSHVTRTLDLEDNRSISQGIQVLEEVTVELQQMQPACHRLEEHIENYASENSSSRKVSDKGCKAVVRKSAEFTILQEDSIELTKVIAAKSEKNKLKRRILSTERVLTLIQVHQIMEERKCEIKTASGNQRVMR
ncbi:hypothetical protein EYZ11_010030 [Aspergillus tanneri]|nr:hypothetical protein EYZ11_010030 [Aspergillus tanneri]